MFEKMEVVKNVSRRSFFGRALGGFLAVLGVKAAVPERTVHCLDGYWVAMDCASGTMYATEIPLDSAWTAGTVPGLKPGGPVTLSGKWVRS